MYKCADPEIAVKQRTRKTAPDQVCQYTNNNNNSMFFYSAASCAQRFAETFLQAQVPAPWSLQSAFLVPEAQGDRVTCPESRGANTGN
ncbi:hypothetical protein FKM82_023239 [Ascaphus truei]